MTIVDVILLEKTVDNSREDDSRGWMTVGLTINDLTIKDNSRVTINTITLRATITLSSITAKLINSVFQI